MKKFLNIALIIVLSILPVTAFAGNTLGSAVYTDIVAYINHYPIPSYNFNGITLIAAEDLQTYGFDVFWNEYARTLIINRNNSNEISTEYTFRPLERQLGKKQFTVTSTDVRVFTGNYQYASYGGIDGKTLININDLACIDNVSVVWVPEVKAVKMWVSDGLEMRNTPFNVPRISDNFTYYETCTRLDDPWIHYDTTLLSNTLFITAAETSGEYSDICTDCYTIITVIDVIDADGNSVLKNKKITYNDYPSVGPYFYGLSDYVLSNWITIKKEDLYPRTAHESGGLVKLNYTCSGTSTEISIRVDQLPYGE